MRSLWILLLLVAAVPVHAADRLPNIVLIVADDLGYGDVGCYGAKDIRTPNIDRLAQEGTRFTHFCVAQPVCTASRAALLSGCYPNRLGMAGALNHTSTIGIHPDETLLPEICKAKGYATACYGKWHLGTRPVFFPTRNGFDDWAGIPYSNDNGPLHPTIRGIPALPFYTNDVITAKDPDQATFTRNFTDKAIGFMTANRAKPFFLYLPHVMPHVPIFASEKFKGKSARGLYGDVVEELDWGIGEILAALKKLDLEDNTLVLFLSDNGPFLSYGNHAGLATPFREGKLTTFEGGVRVPFLARWPGKIPAQRVSHELITGLDLPPTLTRLCQGELPRNRIDGVDLSRLLLGEKDAPGRPNFAYFSGSELHAIRKGNWKLHFPHEYLTVDGPPGKEGKPANHEKMKPDSIEQSGIRGIASRHGYRVEKIERSLFDLTADPGETKNLAEKHPDIVQELTKMADELRGDLGDPLTGTKGTGLREPGRVPAENPPPGAGTGNAFTTALNFAHLNARPAWLAAGKDRDLKAALLAAVQGQPAGLAVTDLGDLFAADRLRNRADSTGRIPLADLEQRVEQQTPAARRLLLPAVREHLDLLSTQFDQIGLEHRDAAEPFVAWLVKNYQPGKPLPVIIICTGNSRRSILSSTLGNVAAAYHGLPEIRFHSGGTVPSAFNPRTVATLKAMGLEIEPTGREAPRGKGGEANPIWLVRWGKDLHAEEFSKTYRDAVNPQTGFAALLVCGEANDACPNVTGASLRLPVPYQDPKTYDGAPFEAAKYAERRDDIGRWMLNVMLQTRAQLQAEGRLSR